MREGMDMSPILLKHQMSENEEDIKLQYITSK